LEKLLNGVLVQKRSQKWMSHRRELMICIYKYIKLINQKSSIQFLKRQRLPKWNLKVKKKQRLKMNLKPVKKVPLQVKRR
jgi:hypothetical protein